MANFITNSGSKNLKERITELIGKSKELKFLVGFFYFSGLSELCKALMHNNKVKLKVLVGLEVDSTIHGLIEHGGDSSRLSDEETAQNFFKSVKSSLNTDTFDTKEFYEQVRFFIKLIKEGKLIIRKTKEPNHSKLYIFKLEEGQVGRKSLFITGSSNLTKAGLNLQNEFNVEISDYGVEQAEAYFDRLWDDAVQISEHEESKSKLIDLIEQETHIKEITPFEAYAYVLKSYLDLYKGRELSLTLEELLARNSYKKYSYQLDAVKQGLSIIEQNNGVIIADVVGLGKTIIACSIAFELKKRGIVIAPPALIGDRAKTSGWNRYLEDFRLSALGWEAYSLGDLESVKEMLEKCPDIEVVIVDEAHRFRNQETKGYELLKNICRGKRVILLTATPFNNKPEDIFSMLKLFVTPKKSMITLTDNLEYKFKTFGSIFEKLAFIRKNYNSTSPKKVEQARSDYKALFGSKYIDLSKVKDRAGYLAKEIKDVIEPVVIRRNRLDLKENPNYRDEIKDLSEVKDPLEWFYELNSEQTRFYDQIIGNYFAPPYGGGIFKGAIYQPYKYEKYDVNDETYDKENFELLSQANLYDLMRRLLVKRFESSFGAFRKSLENFKNITETVLNFVKRTERYILDRNLLLKISELDDEELEKALNDYAEKLREQSSFKGEKIYVLKNFKSRDQFLKDIEDDLTMFKFIIKEMDGLGLCDKDPKLESLVKNLKIWRQREPERKIVIFSEYTDTVLHLKSRLEKEFAGRVLTVAGDLSAEKSKEIYKNFDASYLEQEDKYDILLSTDKISEGFNLNRAGMVINYDIPWNPVRVIQRVGRINRISKKVFDELYIVNFFPTEQGADIIKSRQIAENKMFLIHNALGEDAKIFNQDEEPTPSALYSKIMQNPETMESESFFTKITKEYLQIEKKYPDLPKRLESFPKRVKVAKRGNKDELFVVIKKGRIYINHSKYDEKVKAQRSLEDIIADIRADEDEPAMELSDKFWEVYPELKEYEESFRIVKNENSSESKAINNLCYLLKEGKDDDLRELKPFIRMLREDILEYGTLSEYTLKRLTKDNLKELIKTIKELKKELGEGYLNKEIERLKSLKKEVIIAIENRII